MLSNATRVGHDVFLIPRTELPEEVLREVFERRDISNKTRDKMELFLSCRKQSVHENFSRIHKGDNSFLREKYISRNI